MNNIPTLSFLSGKRKTKTTFIGVNGLLLLLSLTMIGIFSHLIDIKDDIDYTDKDVIIKMSGSFVGISLFLIISMVIGVVGVQFKKPPMIIIYLVVLVICSAMVLTFEVMSFAYKNGNDDIDEWSNNEAIKLWNSSSYDIRELIREELDCCYFNSSYANETNTNYTSDVTSAHCRLYEYNVSAYCVNEMSDFVEKYIVYLEIFGFFFVSILIFLFSIAMALCNNYRKKIIKQEIVTNRGTRTVGYTKTR